MADSGKISQEYFPTTVKALNDQDFIWQADPHLLQLPLFPPEPSQKLSESVNDSNSDSPQIIHDPTDSGSAKIPSAPSNISEIRRHFQKNRGSLFVEPENRKLLDVVLKKQQQPNDGDNGDKLSDKFNGPPCWVMRQAGRYLPEFRAVRVMTSFFEVCKNPSLAAEVTMQPLKRYNARQIEILTKDHTNNSSHSENYQKVQTISNPFNRLNVDLLDAVIIFSDILVIPVAMGMDCKMVAGQGPTFSKPLIALEKDIETEEDLQNFTVKNGLTLSPDTDSTLGYVADAIHWMYLRMRSAELTDAKVVEIQDENKHTPDNQFLGDNLDKMTEQSNSTIKLRHLGVRSVPIYGFSGAPWTLLAYMIEGKGAGKTSWQTARIWLYRFPKLVQKLLDLIEKICIDYLISQFDAGASILQVFDSNAGDMAPHEYLQFCVTGLKRIAIEIKKKRPNALITIFARDAELDVWDDSKYDVVSVSWRQTGQEAQKKCPNKCLQGNMDPAVLCSMEKEVDRETGKLKISALHTLNQHVNSKESEAYTRNAESINSVKLSDSDSAKRSRSRSPHRTSHDDSKPSPSVQDGPALSPLSVTVGDKTIRENVQKMIKEQFGTSKKGYIANLGHGMLPDLNPWALRAYLEAVKIG